MRSILVFTALCACANGGGEANAPADSAIIDTGIETSAADTRVAGDAPSPGETSPADAIFPVDDGGDAFASCLAIKTAKPTAGDGKYVVNSVAPLTVYCDMTTDGGGWTLVTEAMLAKSSGVATTVVNTADENGGLVMQVFANANGCVSGDNSRHQVSLKDVVPWTRLRADYTFAGSTSCWGILGNASAATGLASTLTPYDSAVDVLRNAKGMGGSTGDAFDGMTSRCDNETTNFWHSLNGTAPRTVTAILRRASAATPSGPTLGVNCTAGGAGTTSVTWWKYARIFVR